MVAPYKSVLISKYFSVPWLSLSAGCTSSPQSGKKNKGQQRLYAYNNKCKVTVIETKCCL